MKLRSIFVLLFFLFCAEATGPTTDHPLSHECFVREPLSLLFSVGILVSPFVHMPLLYEYAIHQDIPLRDSSDVVRLTLSPFPLFLPRVSPLHGALWELSFREFFGSFVI